MTCAAMELPPEPVKMGAPISVPFVKKTISARGNRPGAPGGYDEAVDPRIQYARASDGVTIAYTVNGSGPPVVWLPPVPFSNVLAQWRIPVLRSAYEALGRHVRLVL